MTQDHYLTLKFEDCVNMPCHAYIKDTKNRIIECNEYQAKSIGLDIPDIIGRTDRDCLKNEAEVISIYQNDQQVIKTEKSNIFIEKLTFNDVLQTLISFKSPFRNSDGKVIGVFGISLLKDTLAPFADVGNKREQHEIINKILSKREQECLEYLKMGMTAKKIARELNLSPRTIEFYIENMKKKLNCANRTQLVSKLG